MNNDKRNAYVTRESILELLTDEEVAKVSKSETATRLSDGNEYLDLEQIDQGVQRASGTTQQMGNLLPRKAVHQNSWNKILAHLAKPASEKRRAM